MLAQRLSLRQYALDSEDPDLAKFIEWAQRYNLHWELHLGRTRVLVPEGVLRTQLLLQFPRVYSIAEYSSYS